MRFDGSPALQPLAFREFKARSSYESCQVSGACFHLPGGIGLCPKISSRTICTGSSGCGPVSPRRGQRAFESTSISRIILGVAIDRLAFRPVVALPASSQGGPGRKRCYTEAEGTPGKLFGHVRSVQASEGTECAISSKEEATPSSYLNCQYNLPS